MITGVRQILYYKFTSDLKYFKKYASLGPMLSCLGLAYYSATVFMIRCAMNNPDVSWAKHSHNFHSWTTIRPQYQYNLWEPYRDYNTIKLDTNYGPVFDNMEEWRQREV